MSADTGVAVSMAPLPPCRACDGAGCQGCDQVHFWARYDEARLYSVWGRVGPKETARKLKWRTEPGWQRDAPAQAARELALLLLTRLQLELARRAWVHASATTRPPEDPVASLHRSLAFDRRWGAFDVAERLVTDELFGRWPRAELEARWRLRDEAAAQRRAERGWETPVAPPTVPQPPPMLTLPELPPALRALVHTAWLPQFGDTDSPVGWTGGLPRLDPETPWPLGPYSGAPMAFAGAFEHPERGWFQLFFDHWANTAPDTIQLMRLGSTTRPLPEGVPAFREKRVVSWLAAPDLPHWNADAWRTLPDDARARARELRAAHLGRTKLGGWPTWIQRDWTPVLAPGVAFLMQLFDDPDGHMWGTDLGVANVFADDDLGRVRSFQDGS